MPHGLFVTFEGGEGGGKSTHAARLAQHLEARGHKVVLTREPGGTPEGEAIRALLLTGEQRRFAPLSEALLNNAQRLEHLDKVIRPALANGALVVSDRFMDSTRVYQGLVGGVDRGLIAALEAAVVGDTRPDLTFILDVAAEAGLARAARARHGLPDRFESRDLAFHEALRAGFRALAEEEPARFAVIDASRDRDVVFAAILAELESRLGLRVAPA
jgi:dTMP kinase